MGNAGAVSPRARPGAITRCSRVYRIAENGITETDRDEAERLIRRYAGLSPERATVRGQKTI